MSEWVALVGAVLIAAVTARLAAEVAIRRAPLRLCRTNVEDKEVPAVLGFGILAGALTAVIWFQAWEALSADPSCEVSSTCALILLLTPWRLAWVTLIPALGLFLAGLWDDLRGDERPRGFSGHLGALKGGAITGGLVKMVAGGLVGLATAQIYGRWFPSDPIKLVLIAACIALGANLLNLFDRAPGRALKVFLALTILTWALMPRWGFLVAGSFGAALALLPLDLRARGMLGDAGANVLGAMAGFGLSISIATQGNRSSDYLLLAVVTLVLLALNLLSEKVSFSRVIESTPWLARLDHLGRK